MVEPTRAEQNQASGFCISP